MSISEFKDHQKNCKKQITPKVQKSVSINVNKNSQEINK